MNRFFFQWMNESNVKKNQSFYSGFHHSIIFLKISYQCLCLHRYLLLFCLKTWSKSSFYIDYLITFFIYFLLNFIVDALKPNPMMWMLRFRYCCVCAYVYGNQQNVYYFAVTIFVCFINYFILNKSSLSPTKNKNWHTRIFIINEIA